MQMFEPLHTFLGITTSEFTQDITICHRDAVSATGVYSCNTPNPGKTEAGKIFMNTRATKVPGK